MNKLRPRPFVSNAGTPQQYRCMDGNLLTNRLEQYHQEVQGQSSNIDSLDLVRAVERYRQIWKPDKVRVVLFDGTLNLNS